MPRTPSTARSRTAPSKDQEVLNNALSPSNPGSLESTCRICWGEQDREPGGTLLAPCKCIGTVQYVHLRCLKEWQDALRKQGQVKQARTCEVCKQPYSSSMLPREPTFLERCIARGLSSIQNHLSEVTNCRSWPVIAFKLWKWYVTINSLVWAGRAGVAGLREGFNLGKGLVEEQTSILMHMLSAMSDLLGFPYAELLWCQTVACVTFMLVSEIVYTSLLGMCAGCVCGLVKGYVGAFRATYRVANRGFMKLLVFAGKYPFRALKGIAVAARRLGVKVL